MMESSQSSQANQARHEANHTSDCKSKRTRALYICTLMLGVAAFVFLCYSSSSVGAHVADMDFARVRTYTRLRALLNTQNQKCDEDHVGDWKQNTQKVNHECVLQDDGSYSWVVRNCKPGDHKQIGKSSFFQLCVIAMRGADKGKPKWDEQENECVPKWNEETKSFVRSIFKTEDAIPKKMACARHGQKWKKDMACKNRSTNPNGDTCNSYGFYSQCGGGTDPKFEIRENNFVYECSSDTEWKYKEAWKKECDHNRAEQKDGKTRFCVNGRWGEWKNITL